MNAVIGTLRILRAMIGFIGAWLILTSINLIKSGDPKYTGVGMVKIILGLFLLFVFACIRWGINIYHHKKKNCKHPSLVKFWAL